MQALSSIRAIVIAAVVVAMAFLASTAGAHPGFSATALVKIEASGQFSLKLRHDALAFALDDTPANISDQPMYEFLAASQTVQAETFDAGRERFQSLFVLLADDTRVEIELLESPTAAALQDWKQSHRDRALPVKLDFTARATLPKAVNALTFRFPEVLGDVLVTVDRPNVEPVGFPLRPGEQSPSIELSSLQPGGPGASDAKTQTVSQSSLSVGAVAKRYVALGFTHIITKGSDHALFVLGLFLLSPRIKALLWQISAFTVAHTITLTLTTLHIVKIPSIVIEPTIAGSIAFIAIENVFTTKVQFWRPVVAFIFGLVHGMGFASALSEVGLPTGQLAAGLAAFSVGVECGHLTVLGAAFLLLGWWRAKPWYRNRMAIPISIVIAMIALIWMVQRLVSPG